MKTHLKLILFILALLLLITLYVIGKSTESLTVGLVLLIGFYLFIVVTTILQALSYREAKRWFHMSLCFIILISFSFLYIKGISVAIERFSLIKERESIIEQINKETNSLEKEELDDELFEVWIKVSDLDSEYNLYVFLQNLSILILAFMPSTKNSDEKIIDLN
jgi:energy-coupling factor transporter transmembrane protein EcfT